MPLPQRYWTHTCCYRSGAKSSSKNCRGCGQEGEFAGWRLARVDSMIKFRRIWGLKPMGPRRPALELLRPLRTKCVPCRGAGYVGAEHSLRICPYCGGNGGHWTADPCEIADEFNYVAEHYPNAIAKNRDEAARTAILEALTTWRVKDGWSIPTHCVCPDCGSHPSSYFFRDSLLRLCSICVPRRIDALESNLDYLPPDLRVIRTKAKAEVGSGLIPGSELVKCVQCGRAISGQNAATRDVGANGNHGSRVCEDCRKSRP